MRILLLSFHGGPGGAPSQRAGGRDDADGRGRKPVEADQAVNMAAYELRVDPDLAETFESLTVAFNLFIRNPKGKLEEVRTPKAERFDGWNDRVTKDCCELAVVSVNFVERLGGCHRLREPEGSRDLSHPDRAVRMRCTEDDIVHSCARTQECRELEHDPFPATGHEGIGREEDVGRSGPTRPRPDGVGDHRVGALVAGLPVPRIHEGGGQLPPRQPGAPLRYEARSVDFGDVLELEPAIRGGVTLDMRHPGEWIHHHLSARCPEFQAEVSVLVVGRLPFEAESTYPEKVCFPHHEAGGRAEIHGAWSVEVIGTPYRALPDLYDVSSGERHASDLLDPAVRVQEHGAHCRNRWIIFHRCRQGLDPPGMNERIVVEKDDVIGRSVVYSDVVSFAEEPIVSNLDEGESLLQAGVRSQDGDLIVRRSVVHHDDLADRDRFWHAREPPGTRASCWPGCS